MFAWDYLAFNASSSQADCEALFSGNNFFRSTSCFLCKLITMQLNPFVIYYIMYHTRKDDFAKEEQLIENNDFDPFAHGPSVCAETVSDRRSSGYVESEGRVSQY